MHPFFEPLSKRETILLLVTISLGGSDDVSIFAGLPPDSNARLQEKAKALLAIPKEKRIAFIVHEMKQALTYKDSRGIERIDASWLILALKGESPRVVAAVLVGLPTPLVRSLLEYLPTGIRQRMPPREEMKRVNADIIRLVRQMFEFRFHEMPMFSPNGFSYKDIIFLERVEIIRLMRDLGLIELGQAFVAVGKVALTELCRRLPRANVKELIVAVRGASHVDVPDLKVAQQFLSQVVVNFNDTEELFQKAGLWRLAKAAIYEELDYQKVFSQRLPREAGLLFESYVSQAREICGMTEEMTKRLQDSIIWRVHCLAKQGILSSQWNEVEMNYYDKTLIDSMAKLNEPSHNDA